jgi:hypothetical protein
MVCQKKGAKLMNSSNTLKRVIRYSIIFALLVSASALADKPLITSSFSGIWDQPEQESQGIILQIGEQGDDEKVGIAYWFTYGPDLQTAWYLGVGPVVGNKIDMILYAAADIGFMAENLEGNEEVIPVGSLDLEFRNCNHGNAKYVFDAAEDDIDAVDESGEFPIKRISSIYRQRCSGGISDDTPKHGKPMDMEVKLLPVADDASGSGKAKFWERTDRTDFKVEVEDIPDGTYTLEICGGTDAVVQFEMPVALGMGELEFRSPESDEKLNLNFDPRDCRIEVLGEDTVVLTSGDAVLSEKDHGK